MSNDQLVQGIIKDQKIVSLCNESTTIGAFGENILNEFCAVFPRAPPMKIKCVRDENGRILSSKLSVLSIKEQLYVIIEDEESNNIEVELNPDDSFELFHKWQAFTAKQGQKHLVNISKLGKIPEPSPNILNMIEEMRDSSDILVLNILNGSLELLLREFKAYPNVIKFAESNVNYIMRKSKCFDAVLGSIGLLKYFSSYIDKSRYSKDLEAALDRFPNNQGDILKVFEDLGGQNMINKINKRVEEYQQKFQLENISPYRNDEDTNSQPPRSSDGNARLKDGGGGGGGGFGNDFFESKNIVSNLSSTAPETVLRKNDIGLFDDEENEMRNEENTSGMTLERLKGLLESDDQRCRRFALEKCSKILASSALPDPQPYSNNIDVDNILAGHFGFGHNDKVNMPGPINQPNYSGIRITNGGEADDLLISLFRCLKISIHTPKRDVNDLRFSQELDSTFTSKADLSDKEIKAVPMATLLISAALNSPKTDYESVQGALICIDRMAMEWPNQTSRLAAQGYSRLLLTLSHAMVDGHRSIVDVASSLTMMLIDKLGWDRCDMKLEDSALARFLESPEYHTNVLIALSYMLYKSKLNTSASSHTSTPSSSSGLKRLGPAKSKIYPLTDDAKSSIEVLLQRDNYSILKSLWRWSVGSYRKPKMIALELLSGVSMHEAVRAFLVRFEGVSKLIAMLPNAIDSRAYSAGGNINNIDVVSVRFIIKTIVNMCATSEKAKAAVKLKLNEISIGSSQIKIVDLIEVDESIRFYMGMLN